MDRGCEKYSQPKTFSKVLYKESWTAGTTPTKVTLMRPIIRNRTASLRPILNKRKMKKQWQVQRTSHKAPLYKRVDNLRIIFTHSEAGFSLCRA